MFGWLRRATCSLVPGIYFNAWYITCCPKRKDLEIYILIGERLVLGLLLVVYKIPYTAVVCEPSKMSLMCSHHTTVYLVQRVCLS